MLRVAEEITVTYNAGHVSNGTCGLHRHIILQKKRVPKNQPDSDHEARKWLMNLDVIKVNQIMKSICMIIKYLLKERDKYWKLLNNVSKHKREVNACAKFIEI